MSSPYDVELKLLVYPEGPSIIRIETDACAFVLENENRIVIGNGACSTTIVKERDGVAHILIEQDVVEPYPTFIEQLQCLRQYCRARETRPADVLASHQSSEKQNSYYWGSRGWSAAIMGLEKLGHRHCKVIAHVASPKLTIVSSSGLQWQDSQAAI